ncbi:MAG: hypothetical protein ACYSSP_01345 [Planctomycetota bacterium]
MENQNLLGIYLRKNAASVACIETHEGKVSVADAFSVSIKDQEEQNIPALINLIAEQIIDKGIRYSEVAAALDCSMFIQHKIHSDFSDPKQIAQTIRFDAEETLASDVSNIAIAFTINSTNETGSDLTIFTVEKNLLADIIVALQSNKMDPITIEPDAYCLKRLLSQQLDISETALVALLSKHNAYIMAIGSSAKIEQASVRTFLLGPNKERTQVLQREVPITAALLESENIDSLKVCDSLNSLDLAQLKDSLSLQVDNVDLFQIFNTDQVTCTDDEDPIEYSLAYGAALSLLNKMPAIDFRSDFMPYQAKKQKLQKAIRFSSVSFTILLFVIGVFLQTRWFQKNKPVKELQNTFNVQYATIMGKEPDKRTTPKRQLERELARIRNEKSGQLGSTGSESLTARLTRILLAFNKCAKQTKLNIDTINITTKTITLAGSTSENKKTLQLKDSLETNGLKVANNSMEEKGGRGNFRMTINIKK